MAWCGHAPWPHQRLHRDDEGSLQQTNTATQGIRTTESFIAIAYLRMLKLNHLPDIPHVPEPVSLAVTNLCIDRVITQIGKAMYLFAFIRNGLNKSVFEKLYARKSMSCRVPTPIFSTYSDHP